MIPISFFYIAEGRLEDTGFHYTLSLSNGKYKMSILYTLMEYQVVRNNEMKADQLIVRTEYFQIPPLAEYCLPEKGTSLMPISDSMCRRGEAYCGRQRPGEEAA